MAGLAGLVMSVDPALDLGIFIGTWGPLSIDGGQRIYRIIGAG
jgi:hypothetical protein